MSRQLINGTVLYANGAPVPNAAVEIYDLDYGNTSDERILRISTNNQGIFSGTSSEWSDSFPDLLSTWFKVNVEGRIHEGPFFITDTSSGYSLPIILPWINYDTTVLPSNDISGKVCYIDMTPASNAQVLIYDLDFNFTTDDQILNVRTDSTGNFSGNFSNWKDFSLDILATWFKVTIDNKIHEGPVVIAGGKAAPIILPWPPFEPVRKEERVLIQLSYLGDLDYKWEKSLLYGFIQGSGELLVNAELFDDYRTIYVLKDKKATLANLKATLIEIAKEPSIKAIDVICNFHGLPDHLVFYEGPISDTTFIEKIGAIQSIYKNKFRAVFSTACNGESFLDAWVGSGFKVASGSKKIYADAAASFQPFLNAWAWGKSFYSAVAEANNALAGEAMDSLARNYYLSQGESRKAMQVESERVIKGNGKIKISSEPVGVSSTRIISPSIRRSSRIIPFPVIR